MPYIRVSSASNFRVKPAATRAEARKKDCFVHKQWWHSSCQLKGHKLDSSGHASIAMPVATAISCLGCQSDGLLAPRKDKQLTTIKRKSFFFFDSGIDAIDGCVGDLSPLWLLRLAMDSVAPIENGN